MGGILRSWCLWCCRVCATAGVNGFCLVRGAWGSLWRGAGGVSHPNGTLGSPKTPGEAGCSRERPRRGSSSGKVGGLGAGTGTGGPPCPRPGTEQGPLPREARPRVPIPAGSFPAHPHVPIPAGPRALPGSPCPSAGELPARGPSCVPGAGHVPPGLRWPLSSPKHFFSGDVPSNGTRSPTGFLQAPHSPLPPLPPAGIECPRGARNLPGLVQEGEPFSEEATHFTKELVLQREVGEAQRRGGRGAAARRRGAGAGGVGDARGARISPKGCEPRKSC